MGFDPNYDDKTDPEGFQFPVNEVNGVEEPVTASMQASVLVWLLLWVLDG